MTAVSLVLVASAAVVILKTNGSSDGSLASAPVTSDSGSASPAPSNFAGNLLDQADAGEPLFFGDVNGFRFFGADDPPKIYPCDPQAPTNTTGPIEIAYLPTNAIEQYPRLQVCPSGEIQLAVRSFNAGGASFSVAYHGGELAVYNDSFREGRVEPTEVLGKPGAVGHPMADDGYGETLIVWPTDHGFVRVYAIDMPFDEVWQIGESVSCSNC